MRTFIHYDEEGEVVAVVQTESLPEGVRHPFYIEDERHGVLEVTGDEKAGWHTGSDIGRDFKVDVAKRRLVGKSAPQRTTSEATKEDATTKAPVIKTQATEAAAADNLTETETKRAGTKAEPRKTATKTATKKAATKKVASNKAATKKGGRSSGSK